MNEGETIVLDLKPHWWFFARQIGVGAALIVVVILFVTWFDGDVQTASTGLWAIAAVAWAVWLGIAYLDWQFTYFVLTDDRVIYRTGVLAKHGVEIPLDPGEQHQLPPGDRRPPGGCRDPRGRVRGPGR